MAEFNLLGVRKATVKLLKFLIWVALPRFTPGIKAGSFVMRGETIGYVGSTGTTTGNNLHYEVRVKNKPVDPLMADKS